MWACYFGEISKSYRENWKPHTVRADQKEPDVHDVLAWEKEIMYRLNMPVAEKYLSECIQVDWGGWAYKFTKAQAIEYNIHAGRYQIPQDVIDEMEEDTVYGIIDVELY